MVKFSRPTILNHFVFYFILLGTVSCNPTIGKSKSAVQLADVQVILLAGQSNMAGCANYEELSKTLKRRIERAGKKISLSTNGKPAIPLSFNYSKFQEDKRGFGNVFGPEMFLGLTLAEKFPGQNFLFIKRAQGGTSLEGAWNPEWTAEKSAEVEKEGFKRDLQLYKDHLQIINEQIDLLKQAGKTYNMAGIFWMQGENDAAKEVSSRNYEINLRRLIAGYRKEFGVPELPFVMGQINSSYGRFKEGPEMVRSAMVTVANTDKNVAIIKTSMDKSWLDFPKHTDNVHYNHVGQMRLGIGFAEKWIELTRSK